MKAFPLPEQVNYEVEFGMDLRDYFAAKAMQAMLSRGHGYYEPISQNAYKMADFMMAAREVK